MFPRFSRSSSRSVGLASARIMAPSATARHDAPRERRDASSTTSNSASAPAAQKKAPGRIGEKSIDQFVIGLLSLAKAFEQRGDVHLIGLVVAGQRIHDDVDAGAEGLF